jgi:hypothetical protein
MTCSAGHHLQPDAAPHQPPLSAHLAEFKRDGFTVFRRQLDGGTVRQLRAVLEPVFAAAFDADPTVEKIKLGAPQYIAPGRVADAGSSSCCTGADSSGGGLLKHPLWKTSLQPLLHHPWHSTQLLDFCEMVMGPCVQLDAFGISGFPGNGTAVGAGGGGSSHQHCAAARPPTFVWHRDNFAMSQYYPGVPNGGFWGGFAPFYRPPLGVNLLCYLQDMDSSTGPLRVIPRSHLVRQTAVNGAPPLAIDQRLVGGVELHGVALTTVLWQGTPRTPSGRAQRLSHPQELLLALGAGVS